MSTLTSAEEAAPAPRHALMRKKPSSVTPLYERYGTGREWPPQMSGVWTLTTAGAVGGCMAVCGEAARPGGAADADETRGARGARHKRTQRAKRRSCGQGG